MRLDSIAILRSDKLALAAPGLVFTADSRGFSCVADGHDAAEILVFTATGVPSGTIGRHGEGPGEFKGISNLLFGPGDTLYVLDRATSRLSIFGPDRQLVRSSAVRTSSTQGAVLLSAGIVANVVARQQPPFHLLAADGQLVRSWGSVHWSAGGGTGLPVKYDCRPSATARASSGPPSTRCGRFGSRWPSCPAPSAAPPRPKR